MTQIEHAICLITPADAQGIIGEQGIDLAHPAFGSPAIEVYAADMRARRWRMNGDAIIFDTNGRLLDGAKRFLACVRADRPFRTLVVHNIRPEAAATVGTHRKRNLTDIMKIMGGGDRSGALSKALGFAYAMQERRWDKGRRSKPFSRNIMVAMASRYPEMRECVDDAMGKGPARLVTPAVYATALFMLSRVDREAASRFAALALCRDDEMPAAQPLEMLRRRLEGERTKTRQMEAREVMALIVMAWNGWREERVLARLVWVSGGDKPQPFPAIAGWTDAHDLDTTENGDVGGFEDLEEDPDIQVTLERIDPSEAGRMLETMVPNRKIIMSKVALLVRDLENARWKLNGQTVKFDCDNRLCDGQHRLTASVKAGIPLETIVVRGLSPEAFPTLDMQETRGFKHYLDAIGQTNSSHLAAAVKALWMIENGHVNSATTPSNSEMEAYWRDNPDVKVNHASWGPLVQVMPPSVSLAVCCLLKRCCEADAAIFLHKLGTGEELTRGDPILVVRNHLLSRRTRDRKRTNGGYGHIFMAIATVLNGWNAWRKGIEAKSATALVWNPEKQAFPVAQQETATNGASPTCGIGCDQARCIASISGLRGTLVDCQGLGDMEAFMADAVPGFTRGQIDFAARWWGATIVGRNLRTLEQSLPDLAARQETVEKQDAIASLFAHADARLPDDKVSLFVNALKLRISDSVADGRVQTSPRGGSYIVLEETSGHISGELQSACEAAGLSVHDLYAYGHNKALVLHGDGQVYSEGRGYASGCEHLHYAGCPVPQYAVVDAAGIAFGDELYQAVYDRVLVHTLPAGAQVPDGIRVPIGVTGFNSNPKPDRFESDVVLFLCEGDMRSNGLFQPPPIDSLSPSDMLGSRFIDPGKIQVWERFARNGRDTVEDLGWAPYRAPGSMLEATGQPGLYLNVSAPFRQTVLDSNIQFGSGNNNVRLPRGTLLVKFEGDVPTQVHPLAPERLVWTNFGPDVRTFPGGTPTIRAYRDPRNAAEPYTPSGPRP